MFVLHYPYVPDSYDYVAAAESLRVHGSLMTPFAPSYRESVPVPYAAWPPGFPLLIAGANLLGADAWTAARVISLLGVCGALVICGLLMRKVAGGSWAFLILTVSATTSLMASTAMSEGPFALFVAGAWYGVDAWHKKPLLRHIALASVCMGAAMMLRFFGVFVVLAWLWVLWLRGTAKQRLVGTAIAALSCVPVLLWIERNRSMGLGWRGSGLRAPALWRAPAEFLRSLGGLTLAPSPAPSELQAIAGLVVVAATCLAIWRWRHDLKLTLNGSVSVALVFLAAACATVVAARAVGASHLDARLLWPALPFLAVLLGKLLELELVGRALFIRVVALCFVCVQSMAVGLFPVLSPSWEKEVAAVQLPSFVLSEDRLLANGAHVVWAQTGREVYYPPTIWHSDRLLHTDTLTSWAARHGVRYFIWYDQRDARVAYGALADAVDGRLSSPLRVAWQAPGVRVLEITDPVD